MSDAPVRRRPQTTPATQADNLPELHQITLPDVEALTDGDNVRVWGWHIQSALAVHMLDGLVSTTLPHPERGHPKYKAWRTWSTSVRFWMLRQLDAKIMVRICAYWRPLFADQVWTAVFASSTNEEDRASSAVRALWNMRRCQFSTICAYVEAWRTQVLLCSQLHIGITYYAGAKIMLDQVEEELPVLVCFLNHEIRACRGQAVCMNFAEFVHICNGIIRSTCRKCR